MLDESNELLAISYKKLSEEVVEVGNYGEAGDWLYEIEESLKYIPVILKDESINRTISLDSMIGLVTIADDIMYNYEHTEGIFDRFLKDILKIIYMECHGNIKNDFLDGIKPMRKKRFMKILIDDEMNNKQKAMVLRNSYIDSELY